MNNINNEYKKQHTVPVFYLNNFYSQYLLNNRQKTKAQLESRKYRIYVYDKNRKKSYPKSIGEIAYGDEEYFYRIEIDQENIDKNTFVEKTFLKSVDGEFSSIFDEIIKGIEHSGKILEDSISTKDEIYCPLILNNNIKRDMSPWIYLQAIRTKAFRNILENQQSNGYIDNIYNKHAEFLCNEDLIKKYSSWIQEQIWIIGYNTTQQTFFTSDNPVTVEYKESTDNSVNSLIEHDPFMVKGLQLHFPLTSQYILEIIDREYYQESKRFDKCLVKLSESQLIDRLNQQQVEQSYQYIYCSQNNFNIRQKLP